MYYFFQAHRSKSIKLTRLYINRSPTPVNKLITNVSISSGALDDFSRDFRAFCTLSAAVLHHFAA